MLTRVVYLAMSSKEIFRKFTSRYMRTKAVSRNATPWIIVEESHKAFENRWKDVDLCLSMRSELDVSFVFRVR